MLRMLDSVDAGATGRSAALSDGRRHAGRHCRGGRARHGHVRLRDADAGRPAWSGLYALRQGQPANARHADDPRPLDEMSDCPAARDYSRAYLHHLVKAGEILAGMLLTWNNLAYYSRPDEGRRARPSPPGGMVSSAPPPRRAGAGGDLPRALDGGAGILEELAAVDPPRSVGLTLQGVFGDPVLAVGAGDEHPLQSVRWGCRGSGRRSRTADDRPAGSRCFTMSMKPSTVGYIVWMPGEAKA